MDHTALHVFFEHITELKARVEKHDAEQKLLTQELVAEQTEHKAAKQHEDEAKVELKAAKVELKAAKKREDEVRVELKAVKKRMRKEEADRKFKHVKFLDDVQSKLLKESADGGNGEAQYRVACRHFEKGDSDNAYKYHMMAAKNDIGASIEVLPYYIARGHGNGVEDSLAWTTKSYAMGSALAANELGVCYIRGLIPHENPAAKAAELYEESSEKGCAEGMYHFAQALEKGNGVAKNVDKAKSLYEKLSSTEYFDTRAMYNLGILMEEVECGSGMAWLKKASDWGEDFATEELKKIEDKKEAKAALVALAGQAAAQTYTCTI